jgi:hypothetical protein
MNDTSGIKGTKLELFHLVLKHANSFVIKSAPGRNQGLSRAVAHCLATLIFPASTIMADELGTEKTSDWVSLSHA